MKVVWIGITVHGFMGRSNDRTLPCPAKIGKIKKTYKDIYVSYKLICCRFKVTPRSNITKVLIIYRAINSPGHGHYLINIYNPFPFGHLLKELCLMTVTPPDKAHSSLWLLVNASEGYSCAVFIALPQENRVRISCHLRAIDIIAQEIICRIS